MAPGRWVSRHYTGDGPRRLAERRRGMRGDGCRSGRDRGMPRATPLRAGDMEVTIYREHRPDGSEMGCKISMAQQIGLARPIRVDPCADFWEIEHGRNYDPAEIEA